jgi:hypothetical protein
MRRRSAAGPGSAGPVRLAFPTEWGPSAEVMAGMVASAAVSRDSAAARGDHPNG